MKARTIPWIDAAIFAEGAMGPKAVFRSILTLSLLAGVVGTILSYTLRDQLPLPLREFLQARDEAEPPEGGMVLLAVALAYVVITLVGLVGLYLFWKPARVICLVTLVIGFPLFGVMTDTYVEPIWTVALDFFAAALAGAVLAMSYCSPYRELFEQRVPNERPADAQFGRR